MPTEAVPILTMYSRKDCHLCDDMIAGLRRLQGAHRFDIVVVDIDDDPRLKARYGERVPVLSGADHELCQHVLDGAAVSDFLAQFR